MIEHRRRYGFRQTWYSICSGHARRAEGCPRCDAGHWHYDVSHRLSGIVHKRAYWLWYWWANLRVNKRRFINFTTFKGEKTNPFPNLKP